MPLNEQATKLENLIDPEVLAPLVDKKFFNYLKFAPLLTIDTTLQGRPGSTVKVPYYNYIGIAADVAEGADIPIAQLTQDSVDMTIKKAGKGVQITDEAVLSGFGDPLGEAVDQLGKSIAHKVNEDTKTALEGIGEDMTVTANELNADAVADALVKFGEDEEGVKVLFISPLQLAALRKSAEWLNTTEMGVQAIHSGVLGSIWGCQVMVSADITDTCYIVKPGALRLYTKRDTMVETDRDIINKSTYLTADKHYGVHLYDESKAIKITVSGAGA